MPARLFAQTAYEFLELKYYVWLIFAFLAIGIIPSISYSLNEYVVDILDRKSGQKAASKLYSVFSFNVTVFEVKVLFIRLFFSSLYVFVFIWICIWEAFTFMSNAFIIENYLKPTDKYKESPNREIFIQTTQ